MTALNSDPVSFSAHTRSTSIRIAQSSGRNDNVPGLENSEYKSTPHHQKISIFGRPTCNSYKTIANNTLEKTLCYKQQAPSQNLDIVPDEDLIFCPETSAPISSTEKHRVLTILHRQMLNINNIVNSPLLSSSQKATIKQTTDRILKLTFDTIKHVTTASTVRAICELLTTLDNNIDTYITTLKNAILSPMVNQFESQTVAIWVDTALLINNLTDIGLEQPVSDSTKEQLTTYIQSLEKEINTHKTSHTGNLSAHAVYILQKGFDQRKKYILQIAQKIPNATTNHHIYNLLISLRSSVSLHAREQRFMHILQSPRRRFFTETILNISRSLLEIRTQLISSPANTTQL